MPPRTPNLCSSCRGRRGECHECQQPKGAADEDQRRWAAVTLIYVDLQHWWIPSTAFSADALYNRWIAVIAVFRRGPV